MKSFYCDTKNLMTRKKETSLKPQIITTEIKNIFFLDFKCGTDKVLIINQIVRKEGKDLK